jgi:hypothetical protein
MTKKQYKKIMFNSLITLICGIGFITVGIIATIIELIH